MYKKIIAIAAVLSFAVSSVCLSAREEEKEYTIDTPYPHVIHIGTPEWAESSWQENAVLNQLPMEMAQAMTTKALAETVLTYPNFPLIYAYNYPSRVLREELNGYNGFVELLKKEDAGIVLLSLYNSIDVFSSLGEDVDA